MVRVLKNRLLFQNNAGIPFGRVMESAINVDSPWMKDGFRTLDYYGVVYLLDGGCRRMLADGQLQDLEIGDLMVLFPGVPHRYGPPPGSRFHQLYIKFSGRVFDVWRDSGVLDPAHNIYHLQPVDYWLDRVQSMIEGWPANNPFSLQPACSLQAMLAEAIELQGHSPAERANIEWLHKAYELLSSGDSQAMFALESVAEQLNMPYGSFRKKFAAVTRLTPSRYHALLVMRRACRYLHEEAIPSKQIAQLLGFCNEYHFSRRFKTIVGMTPTEYRKRMSG
jgi:AraC-like DNA-binding protein